MSAALRRFAADKSALKWWALGILAMTELVIVLDNTIVTIALPAAQDELGMTDGQRQWIVTAYALAFGSLLLLGGRIADYWDANALSSSAWSASDWPQHGAAWRRAASNSSSPAVCKAHSPRCWPPPRSQW